MLPQVANDYSKNYSNTVSCYMLPSDFRKSVGSIRSLSKCELICQSWSVRIYHRLGFTGKTLPFETPLDTQMRLNQDEKPSHRDWLFVAELVRFDKRFYFFDVLERFRWLLSVYSLCSFDLPVVFIANDASEVIRDCIARLEHRYCFTMKHSFSLPTGIHVAL